MKRFVTPATIVLLLVFVLSVPALAQPADAPVPAPARTASPRDWDVYAPDGDLLASKIKADNAILMDAQTGEVLFSKDADTQRYPASTTKIMTCLLALKSGKKLTDRITASYSVLKTVPSDSSSIGLVAGETMTLQDLLYGLMLMSGNDAASVIGNYVGGGLDNFITMMNDEAASLGMTHTHYTNAHGYPDEQHYTTAYDMALLAKEALKYPEFVKIVSTFKYTPKATNKKERNPWKNHNLLVDPSSADVYSYIYANGIKTGWHSKAMYCFVGSAKKDGQQLIAVMLHSKGIYDKWTDSITMFEYGFEFYDTLNLREFLTEQTIPLDVKNASADDPGKGKLDLILKPQNQAYITDRRDVIEQLRADPSQFQQELTIARDTAPIGRDELVGIATFYYEGNPVLTCDLIAARAVKEMATPAPTASPAPTDAASAASQSGAPSSPEATLPAQPAPPGGGLGYTAVTVLVGALLLVLALLIVRMLNMRRRGRRYSQYNFRRGGGAKMRR